MPRPNEGRTETCLKRGVTAYLRSFEQKERWKKHAEKKRMKLSAFIIEAVENTIASESDTTTDCPSITDLREEIDRLKEEMNELRRENNVYKKLYETQEREIRKYRAEPFLKESFEGARRYDKELVELLRTRKGDGGYRTISNDEILSKLGIDPPETEAVKAISSQLESLQGYGLLKLTANGWMWLG